MVREDEIEFVGRHPVVPLTAAPTMGEQGDDSVVPSVKNSARGISNVAHPHPRRRVARGDLTDRAAAIDHGFDRGRSMSSLSRDYAAVRHRFYSTSCIQRLLLRYFPE